MPSGPYAGCHEDAPVPRPWSPQGRHDGTRRGCSWRGMDARSHRCQDAATGVVVAVTEQDISRGILISIARRWWMPTGRSAAMDEGDGRGAHPGSSGGCGPYGLRVFALGPLRVERGESSIERWGGEKAGTRQALGLFAFLFDRGERGVEKDEALELIWPDMDVERADLAFHRTLGGLRHTLDPGGHAGKRAIRFHNDRYRLDPAMIDWSDVEDFSSRLDRARTASEPTDKLRLLEEARALYRGEYLDDCPFYGDSVQVEERRGSLRGRSTDLLIALGEGYEASGDRPSAAAAYRDAVAAAVDGCPAAEAGLARLAARS